jgi:hypothetical protein
MSVRLRIMNMRSKRNVLSSLGSPRKIGVATVLNLNLDASDVELRATGIIILAAGVVQGSKLKHKIPISNLTNNNSEMVKLTSWRRM